MYSQDEIDFKYAESKAERAIELKAQLFMIISEMNSEFSINTFGMTKNEKEESRSLASCLKRLDKAIAKFHLVRERVEYKNFLRRSLSTQ